VSASKAIAAADAAGVPSLWLDNQPGLNGPILLPPFLAHALHLPCLFSLEFAEIVQVLDLIRAASERRLTKAPADANPLKPRLELAEFRPGEVCGEN